MLLKISDLFYTFNGYASKNIKNIEQYKKENDYIPYKRPSNNILNTIVGYVNIENIPSKYIFENVIMISTDGEGSHTYSYFIKYKFVPNSNVMVLKPKIPLSDLEMIIYSRLITHNRYKFQYGRKPKGSRITDILIPDLVHVRNIISNLNNNFDVNIIHKKIESQKKCLIELPNINEWNYFSISSIFKLKKGESLNKIDCIEGVTPYIGASEVNNSVTGILDIAPNRKKNTFTINRSGSVGYCAFHDYDYFASENVFSLFPKFLCNRFIGIFIKRIINENRFKYSYGRTLNTNRILNIKIKLPVDEKGDPDWNLITDYVKSLPYSEYI